jgi:hypothetical protein
MHNRYSLLALLFLLFLFMGYERMHLGNQSKINHKVTTWDAFGYYMYLPSIVIYKDVKKLNWVKKVDSAYHLTGGVFYQSIKQESGNYTNKYLCGVAIMQTPFFLLGHYIAYLKNEPQDGFSWPYQYAIIYGAIFWALLGFVVLRKVLLRYFSDQTTAITILLLGLCSNLIQYVSIDAAQSHIWIFTLYALMLWFTIKWHEKPKIIYASLIGLTCGLATISRPTELIMLLIPLLWDIHNKKEISTKWERIKQHKLHLIFCILASLIGILPQLMYWKYTTGHFIFDVGSKWYFLNPWFRVLFGPEKGWFLYTPIAVFMVWGLALMKKYPFKLSVLTFCTLNLWIIIAWSDWRYGGSYSTRALVQSYPIFALSLACFIQIVEKHKKTFLLFGVGVLLMILNFYQLDIYNKGTGEGFSPLLNIINP